MGIEVVIAIDASPARVWTSLTDVEHWPQWTPSMTSVIRLGERPLGVGSQVRITQPKLGTLLWTVTELTEGQSFVWQATRPGLRLVAGHYVAATGPDAANLTLTVQQRGLLGRALEPLTRKMAGRAVQLEAQGHKRAAEATS